MKLSPRNQLDVSHFMDGEVEIVDTLFENCDAEFNSRADVHRSFKSAKGQASWARYYLLHEVQKVAMRDKMFCSYHCAHIIAVKLAEIWFEQKETV